MGNEAIEEIKDLALSSIRKRPEAALDPSNACTNSPVGVNALSQSALSEILRDPRVEGEEVILFQALEAWSKASNPEPNEADWGGNNSNESKKRKDAASELSHFIHLKRIKPSDLSTTVASSGLISSDRLLGAFKEHALCRENNVPLVTTRKAVLGWLATGQAILCQNKCNLNSILSCEPFHDGLHVWSIGILDVPDDDDGRDRSELGIACNSPLQATLLSTSNERCPKSFVCDFQGNAYAGEDCIMSIQLPEFHAGNVVTFILDLRERGSLAVRLDRGGSQTIIEDIFGHELFRHDNSKPSFYPSASIQYETSIKFLGFLSV
jgi:hypothetical protein